MVDRCVRVDPPGFDPSAYGGAAGRLPRHRQLLPHDGVHRYAGVGLVDTGGVDEQHRPLQLRAVLAPVEGHSAGHVTEPAGKREPEQHVHRPRVRDGDQHLT